MTTVLESAGELRRAVEERLRAELSDGDWVLFLEQGVDRGLAAAAPYDEWDLEVAVQLLRASGAARAPATRRAHDEISARVADELVAVIAEAWRASEFGGTKAPFASLAAAEEWIEARASAEGGSRVISIAYPEPPAASTAADAGGLVEISTLWLEYPRADGTPTNTSIAPGGSLRALQQAARSLARIIGCRDYQAVGFALADRPPQVGPVSVRTRVMLGAPDRSTYTVTVNFPWVPERITSEVFSAARKKVGAFGTRVVDDWHEAVRLFGESFEGTSEQAVMEWNVQHPDHRYASAAVFRKTLSLARKKWRERSE